MSRYRHYPLIVSHEDQRFDEGGTATETAKPKLKRPPMYKVVMLNDDYTPMEFVRSPADVFRDESRESDAGHAGGAYYR